MHMLCLALTLGLWMVFPGWVVATETSPAAPPWKPQYAAYAAPVRMADGRVDGDALATRLSDLGVSTYYWLVWRDTDWDDLRLFLPKAAESGIAVWPYLVPPSESPPNTKSYSEPYRLDYLRWAEEIARLSREHPNVKGWVIDDFYANKNLYTPEYVGEMQRRAKAINPGLLFLPLMYFGEIDTTFTEAYGKIVDGVVVAYPQDAQEIANARNILNDKPATVAGQLRFPAATPSSAGDFVAVSQAAGVIPAEKHVLHFRELDDFYGETSGYHFKQALVDDVVVWENDAAGGDRTWQDVEVDVTEYVRGKTSITLAFRLLEKQGVGNFPLRWRLAGLQSETLKPAASLEEPAGWIVCRHGAFEAGFGPTRPKPNGRFHIPFIVMTAAQDVEFRLRHGDPITPERTASWLKMCLDALHDDQCDGVVTYCLDLAPDNPTFNLARDLFRNVTQQVSHVQN